MVNGKVEGGFGGAAPDDGGWRLTVVSGVAPVVNGDGDYHHGTEERSGRRTA